MPRAGLSTHYFVASDLVETRYRWLDENSVGEIISGVPRTDIIIVDELGLAPIDSSAHDSSS